MREEKIMRKVVFTIILIMFATTVMLTGCGAAEIQLDVKPEDTALEYWIMYEVDDGESVGQRIGCDTSETTWYLANGYEPLSRDEYGHVKELPEKYVIYWVGPCPMPSDSKKIISIKITDPKISVYGITVDSSTADFEKVFKDGGCEISVSNVKGNSYIGARKGNLNVDLAKLADGSGYLYISVDIGYGEAG